MKFKYKKKLAIILSFLVVFTMLFCLFFVVAEADHDCVGEECPICYAISVAEETGNAVTAITAVAAVCAVLTYLSYIITLTPTDETEPSTLVYLKVKLSI